MEGLSNKQLRKVLKRVDELTVQSMMFGLDIDWETNSLIEPVEDTTPIWLKRWREKRRQSDNDPMEDSGEGFA